MKDPTGCPAPEELSRWIDATADPAAAKAAARHIDSCAACKRKSASLRAAAAWLETVAEPGPDCLSADAMAALIDSRGSSTHLHVCPRCAAEHRALRPAKKATQRVYRARVGAAPWIAAAAALVVAVVGLIATSRPRPVPRVVVVAPPLAPRPVPTPEAPAPRPLPPVKPPAPIVAPAPVPKLPVPEPAPAVPTPAPVPVPVPVPEPVKPVPVPATVVESERRAVAVGLKSGSLSVQQDAKWVKAARIEEGMSLRAEGKTVCEFAGARLTFEASSRIAFEGVEIALHEGGVSAEVAPGASFTLALGDQKIRPFSSARVMMVARPDRVVVEEGTAKSGAAFLHEGVEYAVRKDRLEAQKRRSLPAAARPRENLVWKMDFSQPALLRPRIIQGRLVVEGDERMLAAAALEGNGIWQGQVGYFSGDVQKPLFTIKPGTTIRFRYFLTQPAELELVLKNATKDENYNKPLVSVPQRWTTVTIAAADVPPNRGGRQVPFETGDKVVSWGVFVGKPGSMADLYVDQLEVVEMER